MKKLEKIDLIDRIGRELQSRMSYTDIESYLTSYGVNCKGFQPSYNSKWVYVKELLADADDELIINIAEELELEHGHSNSLPIEANFWKPGNFRLFLSHLASFKVSIVRLQKALKHYAITSFVAHEDITPSKEWQIEIESALQTMDAMAAILMPGFKESDWCDQEVGVAVGRNVLIIPVRRGLDPYGFIGKYQGIQANNKNVGEVAEEIFKTLINAPKTKTKMMQSLSNAISQSTIEDDAIPKIILLNSVAQIPKDILENLKVNVAENNVLKKSTQVIEGVNELLKKHGIGPIQLFTESNEFEQEEEIPF